MSPGSASVSNHDWDDETYRPMDRHTEEALAMGGQSLEQVDGARDWLEQDPKTWVHLPWDTITEAVGALHPGAFWLVGAYTGAGKSTFLANTLMHFAAAKLRTYYLPLEQPPELVRLMWAALACGYDPNLVVQLKWPLLPPNARQEVSAYLDWQESDIGRRLVFFDDVSSPGVRELEDTLSRAGRQGFRVVVIDHFNRLAQPRYEDTVALARVIKETAKAYQLAILVAGQLNRGDGRNPLRMYLPPTIEDVKGGNVVVEECDVALGLYRPLIETVTKADLALVKAGQKDVGPFIAPNAAGIKVLKHRFGSNTGRIFTLTYERGRLRDPETTTRDLLEERYGL